MYNVYLYKKGLTEVLIEQISSLYGGANRKHSDNYKDMQKSIWYHKRSKNLNILVQMGMIRCVSIKKHLRMIRIRILNI